MTESIDNELVALVLRWAEAEQGADTHTLDTIADEGFRLVGPAGFVLEKPQWLERFGDLDVADVRLDDVAVTEYAGGTGVVVSVMSQRATYAGRPADGTFRVSHTAVRRDDGWRLVHLQISPMAGRGPEAPS